MKKEEDPNKWFLDRLNPNLVQLHGVQDILYHGKTKFQSVEIVRTLNFGVCLILDGKVQSSEADEFIYHEALVHPALVAHSHPEVVFIGGGGEGAALREVLAHHSVKRVVMVDLDEELVHLCHEWLPSWHQGAFEDPRVELHYADAREYLARTEERFDVIILDLSDPIEGGPSFLLYTQQFYSLIRDRLEAGGIIGLQAGPCSRGDSANFTAINHTLSCTLPLVFPYQTHIPSFGTLWGFSLASAAVNPTSLTVEEVDRRISVRISKDLRFYDGLTHQGMFSLPKYLRQEISQEKRIITDRSPVFLP